MDRLMDGTSWSEVPSHLPLGFQSLLNHFATQKRVFHQRGLCLPFESSTSSCSLSLAGAENSTIKMELATALIAWETAWLAGAVGMARHGALNPQMGAQRDSLPAQEEMGEGSALSRGIQRTGGFLEAAQVELVNYKMPHLRSVT